MAYTIGINFLTALEAGSVRSGCQHGWILVRTVLLEVALWHSGWRILCCHCRRWSWCPGLRTSTCCRHGQRKKKTNKNPQQNLLRTVRTLFLACRWLPSCCVLTQWRERQRYRQKHRRKQRRGEIERTLILLIRALIPPWQPHPYALIYSWLSNKGPTSKYHHPGGQGFNVRICWWGGDIFRL